VTDPSCFGEWQHGVVSGHMDGAGPTRREMPDTLRALKERLKRGG
jgi:hypothetical protein